MPGRLRREVRTVIGDRLREFFSRSRGGAPPTPRGVARPKPPPLDKSVSREHLKKSHGLRQFVESVQDESGLSILDMGEISQANVSFITNLGHRLHSVDFLRTLDSVSTPDDALGGPTQRDRMEAFLDQTLGYETDSLDGVLLWDALQYLSRPLLVQTMERLADILRPEAYMLAFFHANEKAEWVPLYSYRVEDRETLQLTLKTQRQPVHFFNNRGIERLFEDFESVKFFLSRDNLREVIVRR